MRRQRGDSPITQRDVAKAAGVSVATVSHVINGRWDQVSEATRRSVKAVIRELGYHPNAVARRLRTRTGRTIGVVVLNTGDSFFSDPWLSGLLNGVVDEARRCDYRLLLEVPPAGSTTWSELFFSGHVDGAVILGAREEEPLLDRLEAEARPIVVVDRATDSTRAGTVYVDNRKGALLATRHLASLGHRRIALIQGDLGFTAGRLRREGYLSALAEAGIPRNDAWIYPADFTEESGYRAAKALLEQQPRPTAIFAAGDRMAIGALKALQELGLSVPHDISLVGFDDIPLAAYTTPPLTTIRLPIHDTGRKAAALLLRWLETKEAPAHPLMVDVELVERRTTAPPSVDGV